MNDTFIIADKKEISKQRLKEFLKNDVSEKYLTQKYNLCKNYAKWIILNIENKK
ncbi:MAG TPA: hypothetical protein PLM75_02840 [bacterium]|nr:hypothetical protein [bacterium]